MESIFVVVPVPPNVLLVLPVNVIPAPAVFVLVAEMHSQVPLYQLGLVETGLQQPHGLVVYFLEVETM